MEKRFGERLRSLRTEKKLTQKNVADLLGVSASTVGMYEQGRREPDMNALLSLAKYYDTTVDYLLGLTNRRNGGNTPLVASKRLTEHEWQVIRAYRSRLDLQGAVDILLGVTEKDKVLLYTAAHSEDQHHDTIVSKPKSDWTRIEDAPETDDTLL